MPLVNTYTNLTDVKRILRSTNPRGRIRFSDSYNILKSNSDNTGNIALSSILIGQDYSDVMNYKFQFNADGTTFTMYKNDADKQMNLSLGTGIKQQDFTSQDGYFIVQASKWSGIAAGGDSIDFMTDSHMSYYDASRFIQDAEFFVDTILEKNIRFSSVSESVLRFPIDSTSAIPKSIELATSRISAYMIFKNIYLENGQDDKDPNVISMNSWLREGLEYLSAYVGKWNLALSTSAPVLGMAGTNETVNLNDSMLYKGSAFNLYLPIGRLGLGLGDLEAECKAYNYLSASDYNQSIVSDLALFCI